VCLASSNYFAAISSLASKAKVALAAAPDLSSDHASALLTCLDDDEQGSGTITTQFLLIAIRFCDCFGCCFPRFVTLFSR
jgi:hypothetical protein